MPAGCTTQLVQCGAGWTAEASCKPEPPNCLWQGSGNAGREHLGEPLPMGTFMVQKRREKKKKKHPKTKIPSVTVSLHFGKSKAHLPGTWGLELTFPISFAIQRLSWPRGGLNRSPSGGNVDRGNYLSLYEGFHSAGGQPWGASLQPQRGAHALPEVDRDIPTFLP